MHSFLLFTAMKGKIWGFWVTDFVVCFWEWITGKVGLFIFKIALYAIVNKSSNHVCHHHHHCCCHRLFYKICILPMTHILLCTCTGVLIGLHKKAWNTGLAVQLIHFWKCQFDFIHFGSKWQYIVVFNVNIYPDHIVRVGLNIWSVTSLNTLLSKNDKFACKSHPEQVWSLETVHLPDSNW